MYGWQGKILQVNLSERTATEIPLDESMVAGFLGGRGLGARLLWDLVGASVEPMGPDNVLILATGPMTSTGFQTSGRYTVTTKSPLTGTILDGNSGGSWGTRLKNAGYDALIVMGRADHPTYLDVSPGRVLFKDAGHVWGRLVSETTAVLGDKSRSVLCIGPAGERLVRFAAIMNDKQRALARGGTGAVMGAKQLKAIVVSGDRQTAVAHPDMMASICRGLDGKLKAAVLTSQGYPQFGTAALVNVVNTFGVLPTRNFQQSQFDRADDISGEAIADTLLVRNTACTACPIACGRHTRTAKAEGVGPEYGTVGALGAACGISDLQCVTEANYLCNDLGLDTISAGATIACAMELAERGLLASDLRFGRADLLAPTLQAIALRKDIGADLAEGSARLARKCGAPDFSMSVKGLEAPAYDPRGLQGQGLAYATSNRGACHTRGNMISVEVLGMPELADRFMYRGKATYVIAHQNMAAVIDAMGVCKFLNVAVADAWLARALTATTGVRYSAADLRRVGERIWNLEKLYNLREGFGRADDALPRRLLEEPIADGPAKGWVTHLDEMLDEYYAGRGWDEAGVPTPATLKRLSLDGMAESLGAPGAVRGVGPLWWLTGQTSRLQSARAERGAV